MTLSFRVAALLSLVAIAIPSQLWLSEAANAACTPIAASGVNATCTGTTTNQNGANGFGGGVETNANVTVVQGASVTGTGYGINLSDGSTVINSGSVQGMNANGVYITGSGSVWNSGSIINASSSAVAVGFSGNGSVTNSGSIAGGEGVVIAGIGIVSNSGSITATGANSVGIAVGSGTVTNSGTVTASGVGIVITGSGTVTNSGNVTTSAVGSSGIALDGVGTVINSGNITATGAFSAGIFSVGGVVTNSGFVTGSGEGILVNGPATLTNSGVVTGIVSGVSINGPGSVTNSGVISGTQAALQFFGANNTLTLLPGSTVIGAIQLNGAGDTVNFRGGNHNLTFNTLSGVTVTGTTPFAVSGNRAAAVDPTPFALGWRTLADFTGAVSNAVPQFAGGGAAGTGGTPMAFASSEPPSRIDSAFAALPGLSAYASDPIAFKAPTVVQSDGSAIWARGFAGVREQPADGVLFHASSQFYGGMMGGDWLARPDLRLGAYAGAGHTRTSIDFGSGGDSDLGFAGVYARYLIGTSFLQAGLQGGFSQNATNRTINNNLAAGGIEKAIASFNGWYVSPEAQIGTSLALGRLADAAYGLTPSLKVRYLYGAYGGTTETGTTAPLTVGARNVNVLDERGELKLTRTTSFTPRDALALSAFGGVQGSQRTGGDAISATLLGQAIPFATPGQANVWGGYGGGGLEWRTGAVSVFSAIEYLALSDHSHVLSGRGGLRVGF
ncbi:MAG TPA: autotransporter domain-containing protein [Bradyrhizobium sp.]|nr:autotransporter domain-containing protein [Bradyrhizobium sp.]